MLENVRFAFGKRALKHKYKHNKREKRAINLKEAKTAGIVMYPKTVNDFEESKSFLDEIRNSGAQITVLVYIDDDELYAYFRKKNYLNIVTQHELNWLYIPKHQIVERFISQPFDILIDLSLQFVFPVTYITATSEARFKVGLKNKQHQYFDMMLDLGEQVERAHFIEQLKYYLQNIKTK